MRIKYVLTHHSLTQSLVRSLTHSEHRLHVNAAAAAESSECMQTDMNKIYSQIRCKDCINLNVSESPAHRCTETHIRCVRDGTAKQLKQIDG